MNMIFGFVAILSALGCLMLYILRPAVATSPSTYLYYSLAGAVIFFIAAVLFFYRHWRFEQGDTEGEAV